MATHDMTTQLYPGHPAPSDLGQRVCVVSRRFTGADLTTLKDGTTPSNGDSYKVIKGVFKHAMVDKVWTVVTDADDTSITLDIGYTDDTNTSATAFETDAALNATGVTASADDIVFFDDKDYWITITPSTLTDMDSDLEFVVAVRFIDLSDAGVTEALTAPV